MFLTGAAFTVALIQIPLRLQVVHGVSPLGVGIHLLLFAVLSFIGSSLRRKDEDIFGLYYANWIGDADHGVRSTQ